MLADFRAVSNLRGHQITLTLTWQTGRHSATHTLRIQRRVRAYATDAEDGQRLLELALAGGETPAVDVVNAPTGAIEVESTVDPDNDIWTVRVTLVDKGLMPEETNYYVLFVSADGEDFNTERGWRVMATATGRYDFGDMLYELLPALHKRYDEPDPDVQGTGQLRRFLQIFGAALDQIRSEAEGLSQRHDVLTARADLLPHMANLIGWDLDQTLDVPSQRNEVLFASEIYGTLGTAPNLRALVNHFTGWDCQIKEFAHNIMRSNAVEPITLWEIWECSLKEWAGPSTQPEWSEPRKVTVSDGFDGRSIVIGANGNAEEKRVHLYWHSNVDGKSVADAQWLPWRIYHRSGRFTENGIGWSEPSQETALATGRNPAALRIDAGIWLFWESDATGNWEIWCRPPDGDPQLLTNHSAADQFPAAVSDQEGRIWLFWQSDRRGSTDIWMRRYDGQAWNSAQRVTSARYHHAMPAALFDEQAGRIWLFWSAYEGDCSNVYTRAINTQSEKQFPDPTQVHPLTADHWRNEAPAAVIWQGRVWLFWHSNREGRWQIWSRVHDDQAGWGEAVPVTNHVLADKEPSALVDGGGRLHLFWRSQRDGRRFQSRSIDTNDADMLESLPKGETGFPQYADRSHYTYDTGDTNNDWNARGTVGLYLRSESTEAPQDPQRLERLADELRPFLPVPVRQRLVAEEIISDNSDHSESVVDGGDHG